MVMERLDMEPADMDREAKIRQEIQKLRSSFGKEASTAAPSAAPGEGSARGPRKQATAQERRREEQDSAKLEQLLPSLEEKVTLVEDAAERIVLVAAPLAMEALEELREIQMGALKETEKVVKIAATALQHARREAEVVTSQVAAFAPIAKEQGMEEMEKMTARLNAAQVKIDEYREARKDHEAAIHIGKLFGELALRVSGIELECEKAAMMAEPVQQALDTRVDVAPADIREAKAAARVAEAMLSPTQRLISSKVKTLKGHALQQLTQLEKRLEVSQVTLGKAKKTLDEAQSVASIAPVMQQVEERAAKVEAALESMRESETPFLMGVETKPADETEEILQKMRQATLAAETEIADAQRYINLKESELARLRSSTAQQAGSSLEQVKKQLEQGMEKVRHFKDEMEQRQTANRTQVSQVRMDEAESAVEKLQKARGELEKARVGDVAELLAKANELHAAAQTSVSSAKQCLEEETKAVPAAKRKPGDELARTRRRLVALEGELSRYSRVVKNLENDAQVAAALEDVTRQLSSVEDEISQLLGQSSSWSGGDVDIDALRWRCADVEGKLAALAEEVESRSKSAKGSELKELRAALARLREAHGKFENVKEQFQACTKAAAQTLLASASATLSTAEAQVKAVGEHNEPLPEAVLARYDQLQQARLQMQEASAAMAEGQRATLPLEAKVEFARLQLRWKALERRWQTTSNAAVAAYEKSSSEALELALGSLRVAARRGGVLDAQGLFSEMSGSQREITEERFSSFLASGKVEPVLSAAQGSLAFRRVASATLTLARFVELLDSYYRIVRPVALTDKSEIQAAKKVQMLQQGTLVEGMGEAAEDQALGLWRLPCRVIGEELEGWITLRSRSGVEYAVLADSSVAMPPAKRMRTTPK